MGANVLVSRKLFAVFGSGIGRKSENFGGRFHRDDARGATINVDPTREVERSRWSAGAGPGGSISAFETAVRGPLIAVAFFRLDLNSELSFSGDGGAIEARRSKHRLGVEWGDFYDVP